MAAGYRSQRKSRAYRVEVLGSGPAHANHAFHPHGVGQPVADLPGKDKTPTCGLASASRCIGQVPIQVFSMTDVERVADPQRS